MSKPSGEKTEQPTDKKLRDARKRGQIAKSNDVTTTFVTVFVLAAIAYVFETVVRKFRELFAGFHLSLELQTGGFKWSFFGIDLFLIVRVVVGLVFDS